MSEQTAEYRAWLAKAEGDWLCVQNEVSAAQKPWDVIAFHCQQAAEKYLKSFLVSRGIRPARTHDLARLLDACAELDPALSTLRPACVKLSDFAVDVRYPDVAVEVEEQMAREAIETAERICAAVRQRLPT